MGLRFSLLRFIPVDLFPDQFTAALSHSSLISFYIFLGTAFLSWRMAGSQWPQNWLSGLPMTQNSYQEQS